MTKRIPQVGDKYKCMDGACRVAKTGEIVTITDVFNEVYVSVKYITSDYEKGVGSLYPILGILNTSQKHNRLKVSHH